MTSLLFQDDKRSWQVTVNLVRWQVLSSVAGRSWVCIVPDNVEEGGDSAAADTSRYICASVPSKLSYR